MKTSSFIYKNYNDLKNFINNIPINDNQEVLVQVFTSIFDEDFISNLISEIKKLIPNVKIIGATANVCIYNAECIKNTCVISLTTFDNSHIKTYAIDNFCKDSYELGKHLFNNLYDEKSKAFIIFSTPFEIEIQELLIGLTHSNKNIVISGGISDINLGKEDVATSTSSKRFVFNERLILEDGVVGACLSGDNLIANMQTNCSWLPIGREHIVTEARDNLIISIDNMPAASFYSNYIGKENLNVLYTLENQFPIMIKINGEYLSIPIKNIINNFVETNIKIPIGTKLKLGYGNISQILMSTRYKIEYTSALPVESVFVYSCIGRQHFLGDLINYEMKPLSYSLDVSGFFARGEFVYNNGNTNFVSHTATVLCLSESQNSRVEIDETKYEIDPSVFNNHYKLLYNIIKTTTDELDYLNMNLEKKIEDKIEELKIQYYTDSLTGLPNRMKFQSDLQNIPDCHLAIIDINNFSEVNDFYGIKIGDLLLQEVSNKLTEFSKLHNLKIYRINSDVFGIIDDLVLNDLLFSNIIDTLYTNITQNAFIFENTIIYISVNIGISSGNISVLEKAEMALDCAKNTAGNIEVYAENIAMKNTYKNNLTWITELREAIKEDRIVPFFQGIYNNATGTIEKYETLMRLIRRDGTIVVPMHFLEISKKSGIYSELTKIIINKAFETFKNTSYDFSINLCVEDITDYKTKNLIYEKLQDKSISNRVIFEIVETEDITNYDEIKEFISKIHQYGAKIAIDDFGTGYSNFEYIIKLNIDYLKIDGSIIKDIHSDKSSEIIAETISNFSSKLGIPTIAEFVHNEAVHKKVEKMGLCYSQGYYFSEPSPNLK